mgnify:CR=1 FL=1
MDRSRPPDPPLLKDPSHRPVTFRRDGIPEAIELSRAGTDQAFQEYHSRCAVPGRIVDQSIPWDPPLSFPDVAGDDHAFSRMEGGSIGWAMSSKPKKAKA